MKNHVIILAAGVGNRLGSELPKQFLVLGNKPVLMHTIEKFHSCKEFDFNIMLVLHEEYLAYWQELCAIYRFNIPHKIIIGGAERFYSVKNALDTLPKNSYVGVHDAVRPLITQEVIQQAYQTAHQLGNAVPAVPATNTIRFYDGTKPSKALNRSHIYVVQNPQVFKVDDLQQAYRQPYQPLFTDDATVAEHYGIKINLVKGDQRNIKITHPADMAIAYGILHYNQKLETNRTIIKT